MTSHFVDLRNREHRTAYEKGRLACVCSDGKTVVNSAPNPYKEDSALWHAWNKGWNSYWDDSWDSD